MATINAYPGTNLETSSINKQTVYDQGCVVEILKPTNASTGKWSFKPRHFPPEKTYPYYWIHKIIVESSQIQVLYLYSSPDDDSYGTSSDRIFIHNKSAEIITIYNYEMNEIAQPEEIAPDCEYIARSGIGPLNGIQSIKGCFNAISQTASKKSTPDSKDND